jgi:hypothetical protein
MDVTSKNSWGFLCGSSRCGLPATADPDGSSNRDYRGGRRFEPYLPLFKWPALISINALLISFSLARGTGIFFGLYPARKHRVLTRSRLCVLNKTGREKVKGNANRKVPFSAAILLSRRIFGRRPTPPACFASRGRGPMPHRPASGHIQSAGNPDRGR